MPLPDPLKPYRLYLAMFLLNLAVVGGILYLLRRDAPRPVLVITPPPRNTASAAQKPAERITVRVSGAVNRPGAYQLDAGARLADALQAAGGVTAQADLSGFDLTTRLTDGTQLEVPPRAALASDANASSSPLPSPPAPQPEGKLNLNTATLEQLEQLPGIGPVLAQRILDYRTANGDFHSVDELKNVRGIGDKLFAALKERLTVQ